MKRIRVAIVGGVGFAAVLAGCYVPPSGGQPSTTTTTSLPSGAPTSIEAEGRYDYAVFVNGELTLTKGNPSTYSLADDGNGVLVGTMSDDVVEPPEVQHLELTVVGHDIVEVYSRDAAVPEGVGFEIRTNDVTVSTVSDDECPSTGVQIDVAGEHTLDGEPLPELTAEASFVICDPAAADWFG